MTSLIQIPSSALHGLHPATATVEEHFIIRFPPSLAASVRSDLQESGLPGDLEVSFGAGEKRMARVKFDGRTYSAVLCDLPTIVETHKTLDRTQYVKVADIHQVLLVLDGPADQIRQRIDDLRTRDFLLDDGLTPPMRAVRTHRFSTRAADNTKRMEEVEARVRELLEKDGRAGSVNCTLYDTRNRVVNLEFKRSKRGAKGNKTDLDGGGGDGDGGNDEDQSEVEASEAGQSEQHGDDGNDDEEEEDSSDLDFAAELEGEMDEQSGVEEEEDTAMDIDDDHQEQGRSPSASMHSAMADISLRPSTSSHTDTQSTLTNIQQQQLPPELAHLQQQIQQRRTHLATVTNPAVRDRLEDALRYLEEQLASKLAAL